MTQLDVFYNTPAYEGLALKRQKVKAGTQAYRIMELFEQAEIPMTPLEVADILKIHESSTRRACHVLARQGILEKLERTKLEKYGVHNHYYKLRGT